jgi:hypothetical protein
MNSPLFVKQGHAERSSEAPFDDYLSIGRSAAPIVNVYEAQFVARAAATDASVRPNMVLMYPNPDLLSKHTLVPLTANGDAIGRLLTDDPTLQELAVESGFRVASNPDAFNRFVQQHHVDVDPNLSEVIVPPTYDNLDSLVTKIDAALHAALGPAPAPPATTASLTVPTERGSGNP